MKTVFDPKPVKTFTLQVSFNIGWRHEPAKKKGELRKALEKIVDNVKETSPYWSDSFYHLDAEFSSIVFMGLSEDAHYIEEVVLTIQRNFPEVFRELEAGFDLFVVSGGVKKGAIEFLADFESDLKGRPKKLESKPRRFLSLRELSREQKHFLIYLGVSHGSELYLEVSPKGDRVQYGLDLKEIQIDSIEREIKRYEFWMRRRHESTKESAALLTLMNVFRKDIKTFEDVIKEVKNINIATLSEALNTLENIRKAKSK